MLNHACCVCVAGAADEQYIFDLDVRLEYSDDSTILLQALEVTFVARASGSPPTHHSTE